MKRVVLVAALLSACASQRPVTEIFLAADAEPSLRGMASSLRVVVTGARLDGPAEVALDRTLSGAELVWPTTVGIVPRGNDSTRGVSIALTIVTSTGEVVEARARTTFLPEETRTLTLTLEACCAGVACAATETCRTCACVSSAVDPLELPILGADAGR